MELKTITGTIIFENNNPSIEGTIQDAVTSGIHCMECVDLSGLHVQGVDMSGLLLNGAYFEGSNFVDCNFSGCNFEWADFENATFESCDFSKSKFVKPTMSNAIFLNCDFSKSKIYGNSFEMTNANFSNSKMNGAQIFDMMFRESDFSGVTFDEAILRWVNFTGCLFINASFERCYKKSAEFINANIGLTAEFNPDEELVFLDSPFEIDPKDRITVFRYNIGDVSPFLKAPWELRAKAVKTDNKAGIYGYTKEMPGCINTLLNALIDVVANKNNPSVNSNIVIVELEVDRNKILRLDGELAFSECNIIGRINPEDATLMISPKYDDLIKSFHKAVEKPSEFGANFIYAAQNARVINTDITPEERMNEYIDTIVIPFAQKVAKQTAAHGMDHWKRVERNAIILAKRTGADLPVVRTFAYMHDAFRDNDGDSNHGLKAAKAIGEHAITRFSLIGFELQTKLRYACMHHTDLLKSGDATIDTCFDADRLDLTRVGITPDPEKMATEAGRYYAANPDEFKKAINLFKNEE